MTNVKEAIQNGIEYFNEKRDDYLPWEEYFMSVAFLSAMRSKDPSTQVGACIINDCKKIVGIGYNGMPRGCSDELLPWSKEGDSKLDTKYMYVCHAEMNAIMNKNSADVSNCTLYVALFPCNECAKFIIQSDIREVVYYSDKNKHKPETIASRHLLKMAGIKVRQADPKCVKINLDFCSVDSDLQTEYLLEKMKLSSVDLISEPNHKRIDYLTWEEYFMAMAFLSAQRSKDPSTQVGACVVNQQNKIVGIGYNGMPRRCNDDLLPWNRNNKSGYDVLRSKYMYVCHAEMNAILNKNCPDVSNCRIYVALFPCHECAKIIIQAAILEVVFFSDKYRSSMESIASKRMMDMAGVKYRKYEGKISTLTIDFKAIR